MASKKLSETQILRGIEAVASLGGSCNFIATSHQVRVALIGATSPLVFRSHVDTRICDRRKCQVPSSPNGFYRIGPDKFYPDARNKGKDKRKARRK